MGIPMLSLKVDAILSTGTTVLARAVELVMVAVAVVCLLGIAKMSREEDEV
jgi:hypothetical protein